MTFDDFVEKRVNNKYNKDIQIERLFEAIGQNYKKFRNASVDDQKRIVREVKINTLLK